MATLTSKAIVLVEGEGVFVEGEQMPRSWVQAIGRILPEGSAVAGYTLGLRLGDAWARLDITLTDTTEFRIYLPRDRIHSVWNPDNPQVIP